MPPDRTPETKPHAIPQAPPAQPGQSATHWHQREPRVPPRKPVVPYVPTAESIVDAMLDLANVTPGDVVYDLGCGDGRIVIGAARRGATGVGVDIDRLRVREGNWNAERAGVTDRVRFVRESLYDVDVRPASVVTLYLLPSVNRKLRPKLLRELRTGSRIVSNYFDMEDWQPDARSEAWGRILYLWVVPAWVEGRWKCVMNCPEGRTHLDLRLRRKYQKVSGTVRTGGEEVPVEDGRIAANRLTFSYLARTTNTRFHCEGRVDGSHLRGTCAPADHADGPAAGPWGWGGSRER